MSVKENNETIVQRALDAFWSEVAKAYPEVKSGDLSPGAVSTFEDAAKAVVSHWLDTNCVTGAKIQTEDGYTFLKDVSGIWTDGDMEFGSLSRMDVSFVLLD